MLHEVEVFLAGIGTGFLLSVFFDLLRAFRKSKIHAEWAVALEDFLFWLISAGTLFWLVESLNKGVLRFYIFLGCAIGGIFYYLTITKLVFPMFLVIFKGIRRVLSKCCLIFEIIRKIFKNLIILPLKKIWESIKIITNNI